MNTVVIIVIGVFIVLLLIAIVAYFLFKPKCPKGETYYGGKCYPEVIPCSPACKEGETCENGKCVSLCKPPCKEGEICKDKQCVPICKPSCKEGETCENGKCVSLCKPPCEEGKVCVKGVCQKEVLCRVDMNCGPGFHCKDSACTNSCTDKCPGSQACIGGECKVKHCLFNTDCGKNEVCSLGICLGDVTCDKECYAGLKCVDGICKMCTEEKECNCVDGHCVGCAGIYSCPDKEICQRNYVCSNKVLPKLELGKPCISNGDCISGKCEGFCYEGVCANNSMCPKGKYCKVGVCQDEPDGSSCRETPDSCPLGYFCINYTCGKKLGSYGDSCTTGEINPCSIGLECKPSVGRKPFYGGVCTK